MRQPAPEGCPHDSGGGFDLCPSAAARLDLADAVEDFLPHISLGPELRQRRLVALVAGVARWCGRLASEPFPGNPAPRRLDPVRPGASGGLGVRSYVGDLDGGIAGAIRCLRPAADQLGILRVGAVTVDRLSRLSVPYVAIHELVHVVQGAQSLERTACAAGRLPLWVTEGTADAFATLWIRETFPSFAPAPFASLGRNLLGLRPFTALPTAPDGEQAMTGNFSYRSSSLFRFVAERWLVGDHRGATPTTPDGARRRPRHRRTGARGC